MLNKEKKTSAARQIIKTANPRLELVQVVTELYAAGSITSTGGNVSLRIPGKTGQFYITPSRLFKGGLRPEMLVRMDANGNPLDKNAPPPSSERYVHTEIYKARPDVNAIVHAHSPWLTIVMLNNLPLLPVSLDAVCFPERLPCVPFIMPGTLELAVKTREMLGDGIVVYMQNHGVVVAAATIRQAANVLESLERTAMLTVWSKVIGGKPDVLSQSAIRKIRKSGFTIG